MCAAAKSDDVRAKVRTFFVRFGEKVRIFLSDLEKGKKKEKNNLAYRPAYKKTENRP